MNIPKSCISKLFFIICLVSASDIARNSDFGPAIDKDHEKLYPNCGQMAKTVSSRLINSKESKVHYPWIVRVLRYFEGLSVGKCGGTIITRRYDKDEKMDIKF